MVFSRNVNFRRYEQKGYFDHRGELGRDFNGTPSRGLSRIITLGPQTHRLPFGVMWGITILTALTMAVVNFCTVRVISIIVQWKFGTTQEVINSKGVIFGVVVLGAISAGLATVCACIVMCVAPMAGSSGAPENKGWLNGNSIPGLFTFRNLVMRALATILANVAGYPVGREGPTVTMGSNLAFLITHTIAQPYVRQWVDVDTRGVGCSAALMIDEDRFAHAKRIVCTVGGACGMAMLFDSPIGGIVYMFEEITAASWPLEVTFRAFAATSVCALVSRALLNLCGTTTKAFVVYEWNPQPQPWTWNDVPFFVLLAAFLGPFSALHTRACLGVARLRQQATSLPGRCQAVVRMVDAVVYSVLVVVTYAAVALLATCKALPDGNESGELVRFNCAEGEFNPVASLLLTTSEGAVKRLFSAKNVAEIHAENELLAFVAYCAVNICLSGVQVPSGNFTGSMLIGGLAGRLTGALVRDHAGVEQVAVSGVYAMVGSAAMLCGFKQMVVAVVIFITGCANDPNLIPPLMLSITVSLLLNQLLNERGFDEEQIVRKGIPFLPPEPPPVMDRLCAADLCDPLWSQGVLPPEAPVRMVTDALTQSELTDFPVIRDGNICIGFTTRARLEAALDAWNNASRDDLAASATMIALGSGEEPLGQQMSGRVGRMTSIEGTLLPVTRLAERAPYTVLEDMPASRIYPLFSKAGVRAACVVGEKGECKGMISRAGLIAATRRLQEEILTTPWPEPGDESQEEAGEGDRMLP